MLSPSQVVFHLLRQIRRKTRRSRLRIMLLLLLIGALLIAPFYMIYKPPSLIINHFQRKWPDVLWQVTTSKRVMALTIDDTPSQYTDEILQILKANGATATFFVIGSQIPGREETLQDLVRNGNELGNHGMRDEPSRSLSDAALVEQIKAVESKIHNAYESVGGNSRYGQPRYFRPGSGFFSDRMRKVIADMNYQLILGGIYPHDPQIPFWRINARHILSMLRSGGIIICHDRRSWTPPMLRKVLPEMKRRGYHIVTVTEMLEDATTKRVSKPVTTGAA